MTNKTFREMDWEERREEARKYTSIEQAMKKVGLAQTAYDHVIRGGTPPRRDMYDNPEKTEGELMIMEEIADVIEKNIGFTVFGRLTRQDVENRIRDNIARENQEDGLAGMIMYLNQIGKVPEQYRHLIPDKLKGGK